jgi:hypothetical protein
VELLARDGFYAELYNSQFEHVEERLEVIEEEDDFLVPEMGD